MGVAQSANANSPHKALYEPNVAQTSNAKTFAFLFNFNVHSQFCGCVHITFCLSFTNNAVTIKILLVGTVCTIPYVDVAKPTD